jgi:sugar/nucleoside kinase (ribokinase family)
MKNKGLKFEKIIGTGGIGTGIIYKLEGSHDLGRNESRMARLSEQMDFCKLHIIFHYVARLLKDWNVKVKVLPIGGVGEDEQGQCLKQTMKKAGMDLKYIKTYKNARTLFSVCFQFPDKSGGNITEKESASSRIMPREIQRAERELKGCPNSCMVLAAPEVPLASRLKLLRLGRKYHAFNVGAFTSEEVARVKGLGMFRYIDLLSVNIDEAAMLAGMSPKRHPNSIVKGCIQQVKKINPQLRLAVTCGKRGAYGYARGKVEFHPALRVKVKNSAGAGDAFLSGLMAGTVIGIPFLGKRETSCMKLGRALAAMAVTSPDTIHFGINKPALKRFSKSSQLNLKV